jgi:hypothetical protein
MIATTDGDNAPRSMNRTSEPAAVSAIETPRRRGK